MKLKPKKSLGQNFLVDENVINIITNLGNINSNSTILEIGPGTGNLTEKLILKKPKKIILVEKDKNLSENLKRKFNGKVEVINNDFLDLSIIDLNYKNLSIFGNLPYNVASEILVKIIKSRESFYYEKMVFMFQKEVAERIIAKQNTKNYSRISIISQWKLNIRKIKDISPNCFYPKPKVQSSILEFFPKKNYTKFNEIQNLEYISKIFFRFRRKMIKKPLNILFKDINRISEKFQINLNDRPQKLSPETYYKICSEYENQLNNFSTWFWIFLLSNWNNLLFSIFVIISFSSRKQVSKSSFITTKS